MKKKKKPSNGITKELSIATLDNAILEEHHISLIPLEDNQHANDHDVGLQIMTLLCNLEKLQEKIETKRKIKEKCKSLEISCSMRSRVEFSLVEKNYVVRNLSLF